MQAFDWFMFNQSNRYEHQIHNHPFQVTPRALQQMLPFSPSCPIISDISIKIDFIEICIYLFCHICIKHLLLGIP